MCPHRAQRRRWNHQPPVWSHSAHPVPLGGAVGSIALGLLTPATLARGRSRGNGQRAAAEPHQRAAGLRELLVGVGQREAGPAGERALGGSCPDCGEPG